MRWLFEFRHHGYILWKLGNDSVGLAHLPFVASVSWPSQAVQRWRRRLAGLVLQLIFPPLPHLDTPLQTIPCNSHPSLSFNGLPLLATYYDYPDTIGYFPFYVQYVNRFPRDDRKMYCILAMTEAINCSVQFYTVTVLRPLADIGFPHWVIVSSLPLQLMETRVRKNQVHYWTLDREKLEIIVLYSCLSKRKYDCFFIGRCKCDRTCIVSAARHLHVGMTSIQNGGYFGLKTNYRVYLCCLEFQSWINYSSFFLGCKRFRGVH